MPSLPSKPGECRSDFEFLLAAAGRIWIAGGDLDSFYRREFRRRIELPTYPFERERYWVDAREAGGSMASLSGAKKADVADWFYLPTWKRSWTPVSPERERAFWILFEDDCGLGAALSERLRAAGHAVTAVRAGSELSQIDPDTWTLDPRDGSSYGRLLDGLASPQEVVHCWSVTGDDAGKTTSDSFEAVQTTGFFSLLHLVRALAERNAKNLRVTVLSDNARSVTGEETLKPEKSAIFGPASVLGQEYPQMESRTIDVTISPQGVSERLSEFLFAELTSPTADRTVAYRGKQRWVRDFEPLRLTAAARSLPNPCVCLVTGGLGNIGLALAGQIAGMTKARLVLTARRAFPEREEWDAWLSGHGEEDRTSRTIRKLRGLEAQGAEVLTVQADAADLEGMRKAISLAHERFGPLNGVVHGAGVVTEFQAMDRMTEEDCRHHFRPKVLGTLVLDEALADENLDFCVLLSSLSSVLGGVGFAAYAAANIFMDASTTPSRLISPARNGATGTQKPPGPA